MTLRATERDGPIATRWSTGADGRGLAETKATQATDMGQREGYPLMFTTEPEE